MSDKPGIPTTFEDDWIEATDIRHAAMAVAQNDVSTYEQIKDWCRHFAVAAARGWERRAVEAGESRELQLSIRHRVEAERDRLRAALEKIAEYELKSGPGWTQTGPVLIAREALNPTDKRQPADHLRDQTHTKET